MRYAFRVSTIVKAPCTNTFDVDLLKSYTLEKGWTDEVKKAQIELWLIKKHLNEMETAHSIWKSKLCTCINATLHT